MDDGETREYKVEEGFLLVDVFPRADIRYTRNVTDPLKFDALFSRALAVQLAMDLCIAITGNDKRMVGLERKWNRALAIARTTDAQEGGQDKPIVDPWIAIRRSD